MNKITKSLIGGGVAILCALSLSGCMSSKPLNGSYAQTMTVTPQGEKIPKHYAPKIIYHIKGHRMYSQPVQPHLDKLLKRQGKYYNKGIKVGIKRAEKLGENIPSQTIINQHKKQLMSLEHARNTKMYQIFYIKKISHNGNTYRLRGYNVIHGITANQAGKITTKAKKNKTVTLVLKRTDSGISLVPKGADKNVINKTLKSMNQSKVKKLMHQNDVNPSQAGY